MRQPDVELFDEASIARRRARETSARLSAGHNRVRTAVGLTAPGQVPRHGAPVTLQYFVMEIRRVDAALVAALDRVELDTQQVAQAHRALTQFVPYGGTRVASYATRRLLHIRLTDAESRLDVDIELAARATRALLQEVEAADGQLRKVDALLGTTIGAPPRVLRLIGLALPRGERQDWWRELSSIFAESSPGERRSHVTSHLRNAPRTIWTSWATARRRAPNSAPNEDEQ